MRPNSSTPNFVPSAERRDVRLRVLRTRLHVHSNAVQLETLIGNLVANAVKYTEAGGRVVVAGAVILIT